MSVKPASSRQPAPDPPSATGHWASLGQSGQRTRRPSQRLAVQLALQLAIQTGSAWLLASASQAFSTADRFALGAAAGGGGGRHFTGSLTDGFSCAVCHTGEDRAPWTITGGPEDFYVPGTTYAVDLRWPGPVARAAAALEWVGSDGRPAGQWEPWPESEREGEETCAGAEAFPARRYETAVGGAVLAMDGCGATALRHRWTAPQVGSGPVWLHIVHVRGDGDGTPLGDAFVQRSTLLREAPQAASDNGADTQTVERSTGGCSAQPPLAASNKPALPALIGLLGWLGLRALTAGRQPAATRNARRRAPTPHRAR